MSVESITRKKLGTTYGDIKFVCCLGNVAIFECEENGDDRRISFPLELLDLAVAKAKVKASESTMTDDEKRAALEDYARNQPKPDFDPQDNF